GLVLERDGGAGGEFVALPRLELRLVDRQLVAVAVEDPRPADVGGEQLARRDRGRGVVLAGGPGPARQGPQRHRQQQHQSGGSSSHGGPLRRMTPDVGRSSGASVTGRNTRANQPPSSRSQTPVWERMTAKLLFRSCSDRNRSFGKRRSQTGVWERETTP